MLWYSISFWESLQWRYSCDKFYFQERACDHVKNEQTTSFFASPQCIQPGSNKKLTYEMCLPPKSEILKKTKKIVKKAKAKRVFVATDNDPMIKELTNALKSLKVCDCFVCFEQRWQGGAEISTGAVVLSSFLSWCGLNLIIWTLQVKNGILNKGWSEISIGKVRTLWLGEMWGGWYLRDM